MMMTDKDGDDEDDNAWVGNSWQWWIDDDDGVDVVWHGTDDGVDDDIDVDVDDDVDVDVDVDDDDDVDEVWHGAVEEAVSGNTRPKQPLMYSLHFDHCSLVKMMMIIVCDDNDEVEIMMFDLIINIMILEKVH